MPRAPKGTKQKGAKKNEARPMPMEMEESPERPGPDHRPKVWQPGVDAIEEGEELQFDPSAYHCLHSFRLNWPSLSFDVVRDALGAQRTAFPHTVFMVAGTQADAAGNNAVAAIRLSNLTQMKQKPVKDDEEDESESDSDSEDEEDEANGGDGAGLAKGKPSLQARLVAHHGGVNRIRAMQQQPHICSTWGEAGYVQIWDLSAQLRGLASDNGEATIGTPVRQAPLQIFSGHSEEGFALDWSPVVPGRFATGDCSGAIYLWEPAEGAKWQVDKTPFRGHKASVEDIQWSPTEGTVFASSSVDQTIGIWDTRQREGCALSVKAHDADINVISWSKLASCMLASGCDDGTFRIWDLRSFKEDACVAHFKYHLEPVTSIEWSPHDSSTLATASADSQLVVWDLSLERDPEEEQEYEAEIGQNQAEVPEDVPPQLLFVHQGQVDLKELHWHSQIPGLILSTAADGFNAFKPSNL